MNINMLNEALVTLIKKKKELHDLNYNSSNYDQLEEDLHVLEDDFLNKYGDYLEDALHEVHDEYCPDSDVLLPIAYVPNELATSGDISEISLDQGVYVEVDDYESNETKLVLIPDPTRIVLLVSPEQKEVVWTAS
ncbi:hypothetical protein FNH22_29240 [Fulvivirga sp. M361]|uniref:hypothetical protein n=1 Tax=Fulvivirga sp. M361 TaxID=2594266 RepID=UPI0011799598|nr:hypothetical protein [Fulvivirga sp. M361]TRX48404.1 hypothetical protein FNH22_29240 [Fulvivirga sp. M361]